jgi:hypothetical protein
VQDSSSPADQAETGIDDPDAAKTRSLVALLTDKHARPGQLLRWLAEAEGAAITAEDRAAAVALIPKHDATLKQTRALYHEARTTRSGIAAGQVAAFVNDVLAAELDGVVQWPPSGAAADVLVEIATALAPQLRAKSFEQRSLGVLMLATAALADLHLLETDQAVGSLRLALGEPAPYQREPRNPRIIRVNQLTDPRFKAEDVRAWIDVAHPAIAGLQAARGDAERAAARARALEEQQSELRRELDAAHADAEALRRELEASQARTGELERGIEDARAVGRLDQAGIRAQTIDFLDGRLAPLLSTAREALELDTPRAHIALDKVHTALDALEQETEWLRR